MKELRVTDKTTGWTAIALRSSLCATAFWSAPVSWRFPTFNDIRSQKRQDTGALQNAVAHNDDSFRSKRRHSDSLSTRFPNIAQLIAVVATTFLVVSCTLTS